MHQKQEPDQVGPPRLLPGGTPAYTRVVGVAQPWGELEGGDQQKPKLRKGCKGKLLPVAMRPTSSFSKISGLGY